MYLWTTLGSYLFLATLIMFPQLIPSIASSNPSSQLISDTFSFQVNRSQAYYLGPLPPYDAHGLLYFDWNVLLYPNTNGTGVIQFSQNNLNWSNLAAFSIVRGESSGRQSIDSTWAKPGENYLRAAFNVSVSAERALLIVVNYGATLIELVSITIAVPLLVIGFFVALRLGRIRSRASTL
jgi:hypothetical protein